MNKGRPILIEAFALGVCIFLVANVFVPALGPVHQNPGSTSQQCVVDVLPPSWFFVPASAAIAASVAYAYWRHQRKRLPPDDDEPRCEYCGYILRGLPEPRCPECGWPFTRRGQDG